MAGVEAGRKVISDCFVIITSFSPIAAAAVADGFAWIVRGFIAAIEAFDVKVN
jgi:hypothetical protein